MDYQKAYQILFNGITDALMELDKTQAKNVQTIRAEIILLNAQRKTEHMYIEGESGINYQKEDWK